MKTILTLFSFLTLTAFAGYGQDGVMSATQELKTYTVSENGKEKQFSVKVMEHRKYAVELNEKDKGMVNQDRKSTPAFVTKLIAIDYDADDAYDSYTTLKYKGSDKNAFEMSPTDEGFEIRVNDRKMHYNVLDDMYYIKDKNKDFFIIEEFTATP
ncbi:hypothetical protein [Flagellimonas marina]|uniref:Uncharacterized protein n=1 Tax=Flagellimonas marina TaxID=1775168 RepID=A0ABV8PMN3_9FLAO